MITALYQIPEDVEIFLYAVPNDFSYPIYLTNHVYASLMKATARIGSNNVIHLRILTPASFIFEVNPSQFGAYGGKEQGALNASARMKQIQTPQMKSITADVEGFYWQKEEDQEDYVYNDGTQGPTEAPEYVRRLKHLDGIETVVSLNPEMSTIELKDNKNNLNYAARIQISNNGSKKLLAMNWSLRQVLVRKGAGLNYPLPDLEPGKTYDLIFNLNLKERTREVTYWSLCILDADGEETFFGCLMKAFLEDKQAKVTIIDEKEIPAYISGLYSHKMQDDV